MSDEVKLPSEEMVERAYREGFKDGRYSSYKVGSANNADEGWPSSEARAAIEATRPTIVTGQLEGKLAAPSWQPMSKVPTHGRRIYVLQRGGKASIAYANSQLQRSLFLGWWPLPGHRLASLNPSSTPYVAQPGPSK